MNGEKTKEKQIYNSAVKLFGKFGVKRVSIDMIVKDAGVAKGTFYIYFKNKETLYEQIIGDILEHGKKVMFHLEKEIPDVKERFFVHMIGSLEFFKNNNIVLNLINHNEDFFIGKINHDYLYGNHIALMKILLGNDFKDEDFVNLVANVKGFFINVLNHQDCFESEEEYKDFILKLAGVIVNGLFSDYNALLKERSYDDIGTHFNKLKS
ncbi:TetR/AcrR family transcriptional regulator [Candidatus Gracilibacteria bacterium 28_42_T64]|nr:TetR/AcrR family transcriptional regulator [Candidatus Gracilibacteria bacterium 28_42_T64]